VSRRSRLLGALLAPLALGCSVHVGDLSAVSTRAVRLERLDLARLPRTDGVVGRDSSYTFLLIPFHKTRLEAAVERALDEGHGDLLIDATVTQGGWFFLVGQRYIEVRGTVVDTRGAAP
jgi:hypothetical protein